MMTLNILFTVLEGEGSYIQILGSTEMASAFFLDFGKKPTVGGVGPYYICRTCQTHIALLKERVSRVVQSKPPKIFFKKVVNVIKKDGPEHRRPLNRYTRISFVYCVKCTTRLGIEYISTSDPPRKLRFKYTLQMDRLILNEEGQLLNSITGKSFTVEPHPKA